MTAQNVIADQFRVSSDSSSTRSSRPSGRRLSLPTGNLISVENGNRIHHNLFSFDWSLSETIRKKSSGITTLPSVGHTYAYVVGSGIFGQGREGTRSMFQPTAASKARARRQFEQLHRERSSDRVSSRHTKMQKCSQPTNRPI